MSWFNFTTAVSESKVPRRINAAKLIVLMAIGIRRGGETG
jgi:hypothetical protein